MTTPDIGSTALAGSGDGAGSRAPGPPLRPVEPSIPKKAKSKRIQVSPVVLDAARKGSEELFLQLRTAASGLSQSEAESRARSMGPNEVAQEKPQGWPVRLLKITLNPLVILLTVLSGVGSSATAKTTRAVLRRDRLKGKLSPNCWNSLRNN